MKTIFIVITRGFIIRNILRSGVLTELKKTGHRIVIFLSVRGNKIPQYLKDEFEDKQVILEPFVEEKRNRAYVFIHHIFTKLVSFLVYTDSTWAYSQIGSDANLRRPRYRMFVERFVFGFLSRSKFLKRAARYIDRKVFASRVASAFFDKYSPSVIFSTSVISSPDIAVMQEARRRGIKTVSMPKGWDNVTKSLYRFVPDRLVVHNEIMKEGAIREQRIPAEKITVSGFPQFDWTRRPEIIRPREEHLKKFGFDLKTI